ncbi:MAG: UDP-2,3-diacylglucosamine diphosphatase [Thermodesulfobacteriota bacterium]|nr:UDP-2,3-diacylglucosamine diphosphatase [Thermodesulfobacteriota bacterium]
MKDIFIADAHLTDPNDASYRHLIEFLSAQRGQIRHLILLGDIFEFWVGYRHCVFSAYLPLLQMLQQLHADGTQIVMVEGNHDFHMGPFFSDTLHSTIISDGDRLHLDNTCVYLCHGDTLAATPNYLRLRRFFRSAFARLLIRLLPADTTWKIAETLGNASRKHRQKQPQRNRTLPKQAISQQATLQFDQGCDAFICGHFHQPWHQQQQNKHLLVVGNWGATCHYAVHEHGRFSLEQYVP